MRAAASGWLGLAAVALLGAAPVATPPPVKAAPQVAAGAGYAEQLQVDLHSTAKVTILGGTHTVPNDMHLKATLKVKVLAASGGRASRVQLTYAQVDAPGRAGAQERKVAGRTFVVARGRTAQGDPQVTEGGKAITGKLARKVWDDVSNLLAPPPVIAFRRKVLASPGKALAVPKAIFPELTGSLESHRKLVSATLTLVKVDEGKATLRLVAHEQVPAGSAMTLDLTDTRTLVIEAATGHTLKWTYQSTIDGSGKVGTPIGQLPATIHGQGTGGAQYTWHAAAKPTPRP